MMPLMPSILQPGAGPRERYPGRPITLVIPFAQGGAVDLMGRGLADAVQKYLLAPVVVENRPGADGTAGISEVLLARPDGYTIGLGAVAILAVQPHLVPLPYRTPDDCAPLIKVASIPTVLFVRGNAPWKTASELLEFGRANPGKLKVGIGGIGRISHLNLEQLKLLAGVDLTIVPFEGPRQIPALLEGRVDAAVANQNPVLEHVQAGRIRVVGVFQEARNPLFPKAQTLKELGYDVALGLYHFLLAPKGTPPAVILTLHDAFRQALADPSFVALAERNGFEIHYQGPEALARDLRVLFERYGRLVQCLGLNKQSAR